MSISRIPASSIVHLAKRVDPSVTAESSARDIRSFTATITMWIVATTTAIFVGILLATWAHTGQVWDGIALGAFSALWGGPGFGVMLGGNIWVHRSH